MSEFIPVTDELLERAHHDRGFRQRLLSEHLDELMAAMSNARNRAKSGPDPDTAAILQEGARLAAKLREILHAVNNWPAPGSEHRQEEPGRRQA